MPKADRALIAVVLFSIATRTYLLFTQHAFLNFDSVFQLLEPAHYLVYGSGIITWEYVEGARPILQTLIITCIYQFLNTVGITDYAFQVFSARAYTAVLSIGVLALVYKSAKLAYGEMAARYALFFAAFSSYLLAWSVEPSSHMPSILFSYLSIYLILKGLKDGSNNVFLLSGMSLGLAFAFRFDCMILLAPISVYLIWQKRNWHLAHFTLGLVSFIILQGFLDYLFWGDFLHSPIKYFNKVIIEGGNYKIVGNKPIYYYLSIMPPHIWAFAAALWAVDKKEATRFLMVTLSLAFIILIVVSHKEMRYILLTLPLVFILGGAGLAKISKPKLRTAILVATFCFFFIYQYGFQIPESIISAVSFVGQQDDSTGLAYHLPWYQTGGYTILHKSIPMVALGEEGIDPLQSRIVCSKPKLDFLSYQCSPIKDVLATNEINYLIDGSNKTEKYLSDHGFAPIEKFEDIIVYKRGT